MNLSIKNVTVKIKEKIILHNLNYNFLHRKRTTIIGENGAGKSTLLKTLCLLNENFSGTIEIDNKNIREVSRRELSKIIAILPQEHSTPSDMTVECLVSFGRFSHKNFLGSSSKEDLQAIETALELTRLRTYRDRRISSLSGGEKQRVWLAMVLAQRPKILLLDEPMTYLDVVHQMEVVEIINEINQKFLTTIIMVLHDLNYARMCSDEVLILKGHKIYASGATQDILTPKILSKVFKVSFDIFRSPDGNEVIFPKKKIVQFS